MKRQFVASLFVFVGIALLIGAAMVSCAPDTTAPTFQTDEAALTPVDTNMVAVADSELMTVANVQIPPFTDTTCLDCHTNRELLEQLAKPPVVVEVPSEGPG